MPLQKHHSVFGIIQAAPSLCASKALGAPVLRSRSAQSFDFRLDRVALYSIHFFGTFPPLAASWRMTSLWSQTFIFDEPFFVSPE